MKATKQEIKAFLQLIRSFGKSYGLSNNEISRIFGPSNRSKVSDWLSGRRKPTAEQIAVGRNVIEAVQIALSYMD